MNRVAGLLVAVAAVTGVAGVGCGDDPGPPSLTPAQLVARLEALGVTVEEGVVPTNARTPPPPDMHYYVLHFTQLIDHKNPGLGTFQQRVSLLHRDETAPNPLIVQTNGYADSWGYAPVELTLMLGANQISIEHRYFGASRPEPLDWANLTIEQMAADEHEIIVALRTIYQGAFLTTGASKGGMTAVFHRRFFPDDVEGTVSYAAPLSYGTDDDPADSRYQAFYDEVEPAECRAAVRNLAEEMLQHRRADFTALAELQPGHAYTRVELGAAVESAIVSLEWSFWQNLGVAYCGTVPAEPDLASSESLFAFLETVSKVSECDDTAVRAFEGYQYQAYTQLGYPGGVPPSLVPWMVYTEAAYLAELPTPEPAFDKRAMLQVDDFVEHQGDRLLFIYGAWDPWTHGQFVLGDAQRSAKFHQPEGTHKAQIAALESKDRNNALTMLERWTGVTPNLGALSRSRGEARPEPGMDARPVLFHGLRGAGK